MIFPFLDKGMIRRVKLIFQGKVRSHISDTSWRCLSCPSDIPCLPIGHYLFHGPEFPSLGRSGVPIKFCPYCGSAAEGPVDDCVRGVTEEMTVAFVDRLDEGFAGFVVAKDQSFRGGTIVASNILNSSDLVQRQDSAL